MGNFARFLTEARDSKLKAKLPKDEPIQPVAGISNVNGLGQNAQVSVKEDVDHPPYPMTYMKMHMKGPREVHHVEMHHTHVSGVHKEPKFKEYISKQVGESPEHKELAKNGYSIHAYGEHATPKDYYTHPVEVTKAAKRQAPDRTEEVVENFQSAKQTAKIAAAKKFREERSKKAIEAARLEIAARDRLRKKPVKEEAVDEALNDYKDHPALTKAAVDGFNARGKKLPSPAEQKRNEASHKRNPPVQDSWPRSSFLTNKPVKEDLVVEKKTTPDDTKALRDRVNARTAEMEKKNPGALSRRKAIETSRVMTREDLVVEKKVDPADVDEPEGHEDDGTPEHLAMQLRKVVSLRGKKPVHFLNGKKHMMNPMTAHRALAKHDAMKPNEKEAFIKHAHKSIEHFHKAMAGEKDE
jgi:hypothetical protein